MGKSDFFWPSELKSLLATNTTQLSFSFLEDFCLLLHPYSFTAYHVRTRLQLKSAGPRRAKINEPDKPTLPAGPSHKFTQNTDIAVLQHKVDLALLIPPEILHPRFKFWPFLLSLWSEHIDKFFWFIFLEEIGRALQLPVVFIQLLI